jgi:DNA-binding transcriptional LysR family regulator
VPIGGYAEAVQLTQLAYFVAVSETRHFTRAARQLHVAQPSLSQQVRALERELGTPLFTRTRGNIALTEAGEVLLPLARRMLADADRAQVEVRELLSLRRGRLRLGATPSLLTGLLPDLIARFAREHPGVRLTVSEAGSRALVDELAAGGVDLAMVILPLAHPDPTLVTAPLREEELVLASAAGTAPPYGDGPVALADLAGVPLVVPHAGYDLHALTVQACRAAGFEPVFAVAGGELDAVLALVGAGLGVAVLPGAAVRRAGLRATPIAPPGLRRTIGLAYRADTELPRAAQEFRAALLAHLVSSGD